MAITNFVRGGSVFKGAVLDGEGAAIGGPVQMATVTLTDDEIKSLPTAPVEIIPAPGIGKRIQFLDAWCQADFGDGGAYGDVSGSTLCFRIAATNPAASNQYHEDIEGGLGSSDDGQIWHFGMFNTIHAEHGFVSEWMAMTSQVENQPLVFVAEHVVDDSPVNFSDGNAANTLKITVFYSVLEI